MRPFAFLPAVALTLAATLASAHEFWIDPQAYQVAPGEQIVAGLRVGQNFQGSSYSYFPSNFTRFDIVTGQDVTPVTGRMGDIPALNMAAPGNGLAVIVHETTDNRLTYSNWQTFVDFVTHKAFPGVLETHQARGLPETGFAETYRRYAKALIAVGDGAGSDRRLGLETEIVAGANPYTDDMTAGMPVQVFYQDAPHADAQLEVFDRAPGGAVNVLALTLDAQGRAVVPVAPGHVYLLDAVVLRSTGNDDPTKGPVWHSLWAALTFALPD